MTKWTRVGAEGGGGDEKNDAEHPWLNVLISRCKELGKHWH